MAYSNKKIPNDPSMFPPIQTWMSWLEDADYTSRGKVTNSQGEEVYDYELVGKGEGKLRHHYSLADARKSLMWVARTERGTRYRSDRYSGVVALNFAVYEWVEGEWVLRFEGHQGQKRKDCPLFARNLLSKQEKTHPIDQSKEERAIRSILEAAAS